MRKQNLRKVKWDSENLRAYVIRDGVRFWSPQETTISQGAPVEVLNPSAHAATVKYGGMRETWLADATSPGDGG